MAEPLNTLRGKKQSLGVKLPLKSSSNVWWQFLCLVIQSPRQDNRHSQPICATKELPISDEVIWKAQQEDPHIQELYQSILKKGDIVVNASTKFIILEDMVYGVVTMSHKTIYQLYIPEPCRLQLLHSFYEDPLTGHLVYWPRLSLEARDHVRSCQVCQAYKPESRKVEGKLQQTIIQQPWEMVGVDLIAPFLRSSKRNLYLLVFVDYFSGWIELFPREKLQQSQCWKYSSRKS